MNSLEIALDWAADGVPVFPCRQNKAPLTKNGHKDASTDVAVVTAMFTKHPKALVGARMGAESGLFVVDADTYKGTHVADYIDGLVSKGMLPETLTHTTKNGGTHYFYEHDTTWPNLVPSEGVDVKGEGGYVIVPPSAGYSVAHAAPIARAPQALIMYLQQQQATIDGKTKSDLTNDVVSGTTFHDSLARLAAKEAAADKSPEQIMDTLLGALETSVARNSEHPRHDRWLSLMQDKAGEVTRIARSATVKFSNEYLRETSADAISAKQVSLANALFPASPPDGEVEVITYTRGVWPFEGEGYFASADIDIASQDYVMYPVFAENETVMLYADPKVGKTAWNLTASLHIACGLEFGTGLIISRPRPCLYYALEGNRAIELRIMAWRKHMAEQGVELPKDIPLFVVSRSQNFLKEDERKKAAAKIIAADKYYRDLYGVGLGVVSLDTLTKAMATGDQNSVDDTSALFELVGTLRDGGVTATIVFVHHKARSGGVRGSTNIEAEPDVLLEVSKGDKGPTDIAVTIARARSIEDGGTYNHKTKTVELGENTQGIMISSFVVLAAEGVDHGVKADLASDDMTDALLLKAIADLGAGSYSRPDLIAVWEDAGLMVFEGSTASRGALFTDTVVRLFGTLGVGLVIGGVVMQVVRRTDGRFTKLTVTE